MAVLLLGTYLLFGNKQDPAPTPDNTQSTVVVPETPPLDFSVMNAAINTTVAAYPGFDIGVAVIDIKTGESMSYGAPEAFVAASTAKVLTAVAYLHDVEQGNLTLTQQVGGRSAQQALEALIVDSDNQAWYDLNNVVMSHAELAAYAERVGFVGYDPDQNSVVASSMATLLSNLYQGRLLNPEHTKLLLSYMQRATEVEYITSIVPTGTVVYHKPGYLKDRIHDALVIDNGSRPYVLVVFTKSRTATYDSAAGEAIFKQIAQATFETFIK